MLIVLRVKSDADEQPVVGYDGLGDVFAEVETCWIVTLMVA